ncbi:hypothetical protein [Methylovulum psychrotolerans]|uniref:hypothetical protein n=1 Tax=Methylovulum psychrotolerans TaxID=1704499 RepID=UPI000CDE60DD|nr:hypothetical protein [Methylovulum psychrotolerans]
MPEDRRPFTAKRTATRNGQYRRPSRKPRRPPAQTADEPAATGTGQAFLGRIVRPRMPEARRPFTAKRTATGNGQYCRLYKIKAIMINGGLCSSLKALNHSPDTARYYMAQYIDN